MLGAVWALLKTPIGKDAAAALGVVLAVVAFALHERSVGAAPVRKAQAEALQAAQAHAATVTASAAQTASAAGSEARATQSNLKARTDSIIQKVHDEKDAFGTGALGPLGVWSYNASLGLPADASASPGAASGLALPAAWPTVIANNGACQAEQARADALVRLWDQTRAAINGG